MEKERKYFIWRNSYKLGEEVEIWGTKGTLIGPEKEGRGKEITLGFLIKNTVFKIKFILKEERYIFSGDDFTK